MSRPAPTWPRALLAPPYAAGEEPGLVRVLADLLEPSRPTAGRDVIVLLDGVGAELLAEHLPLTPVMRSLRDATRTIRTVAPATTAAAMTSFTTGLPPLAHGTLGYTVFAPGRTAPLQQLSGEPDADPCAWMPLEGLAERSARRCVHVGPAKHGSSFLTRAAYAGWEFTGFRRRDERVDAVRLAVRRAGADGVVLVHVDEVDHAGHRHGTDSPEWRDALADADAFVGALRRRLPQGTRLHITADHGMVDTSAERTIDLASMTELEGRIAGVAGEPRFLTLRGAPDEQAGVREHLTQRLSDQAVVLDREELLASGILGPAESELSERVAGRLPDLAVITKGRWTVTHTRFRRPSAHPEVGVHGSLTPREALVPLIRTTI